MTNSNYLNNIPNICNEFNNNFDDIIILLFIDVLYDNQDKFLNFNNVNRSKNKVVKLNIINLNIF